MAKRLHTIEERLREYSIPEPNSGCQLWTGVLDGVGYGMVWVGHKKRGAHVVSWELENGRPVAPGMLICHHCDVRCCINAAHLFEGTPAANTRDMMEKGRYVPTVTAGESHYMAKLSDDAVRAIRVDSRDSRIVAAEYDIHRSVVYKVRSRKAWGHVI